MSREQKDGKEDFKTTINAGDFQLTINNNKLPNPFNLLKQLYELRHSSLSKEEKERELKNITKDFMGG